MPALGLRKPPARVAQLLTYQKQLRNKILHKQRDIERFETDWRDMGATLSARARPILEEVLRLDAAIHASFEHILRDKTRSRPAQAGIRAVYQTLQSHGTISTPNKAPERRAEPDDDPRQDVHVGRDVHLRDLRKTFLAVADAIHPDKVQSDEEKLARTEAMKVLNQAYRDGDVARILEFERTWKLEGKLDPGRAEDELKRRCESIERSNALLAEQLRTVSKALRELRHSEQGALVKELRRLRRERNPDPIAQMVASFQEELDTLRHVARFVQAFQDGEMSLAQFVEGPGRPLPDDAS